MTDFIPRADVEQRLEAAAQSCKHRGAQLTELRRSVLQLVIEAESPLTAYQLLERLQASRKGAVPPTIYRALDFLLQQRLIHKVERLGAFVSCSEVGHPPHDAQFLICRRCGSVAEIEDAAISDALGQAAARAGFQPGRAVVEIDGTCAACAEAA